MSKHIGYIIVMHLLLYGTVSGGSSTPPPTVDTAVELPPDVFFIAQGIQNTADTALRQAVGSVRSQYQRKQGEQVTMNRLRKFNFSIDGDKMRWDRYFTKPGSDSEYMLSEQYAFNGQAVSQFLHRPDGQPTSTAHIRPAELCRPVTQSTYNGDTFHPKYLYIPRDFYGNKKRTFVEMLEHFSSRGYTMSVEGDIQSDSTVVLRVGHSFGPKPMEMKLHVDIANGFLIKTYQQFVGGECIAEAFREFKKDPESGAMMLVRFEHRRYSPGFKEPSTHVMEIEYESVNKPVPAETFTLAGFDLPLGTKIMDMRFDQLTYQVGTPEQIEQELDTKIAEIDAQPLSASTSGATAVEDDSHGSATEELPLAAPGGRIIGDAARSAWKTPFYPVFTVGLLCVLAVTALMVRSYRHRAVRR